MIDLNKQKCVPCEGGLEPLSATQAQHYLSQLSGWNISNDGKWLCRKWQFHTFKEALAFVNRVAGLAESEGHHPDIRFGWGYAELTLQTHAINGLHENDFILASKIG